MSLPRGVELTYQYLSDYQTIVLAVFVVGFFTLTAIAIAYHRRPLVRRGYLAVFFSLLLFVNVTTFTLFPFMHWYKFSEPRTEELSSHLIKVADSDGKELLYDARATPPLLGSSLYTLGYQMEEFYSEEKRSRVGRYLLAHACWYRERVERGSIRPLEWVEFPRHVLDYEWSRRELSTYAEFTAIRVYGVEIRTSEDGLRATSYEETRVLEIDPGNCTTLAGTPGGTA
jgi:hypothetical protein